MSGRFDDWEGETLKHYGVLGMKWGIRKDAQKAYEKATVKRQKLSGKETKALAKAVKANARLVKVKTKAESKLAVANKYDRKLQKAKDSDKAAKMGAKAQKYHEKTTSLESIVRKYEMQASKANLKKDKATLKGKKWCEAMLKAFDEPNMEALDRKYHKG